MSHGTSVRATALAEAQPIEVSLVQLVLVLSELTEDEHEIFATVHHMVSTGSVRLARSVR
jgi:hypothetical protein